MENLTAVCVLGMHRSGTSLVAGVTKLVGVYFGPAEHLMKPNSYNTKGYQEHQSFVKINETILSRFGGKWYDPPKLPPGWENAPQLDDLKQQARAMIDQEFAQAELWGWKDPRTCLTLALWQQLVPGILYLICLRHPMSVVRSLEHRDHLSLTRSVYLWLFYLNSALAQIAGHQRTVIFYEDLLDDWHRELQILCQFLGRPEKAAQVDVRSAVQKFVDQDLYHHRTSRSELTDQNTLDPSNKALHIAEKVYLRIKQERSLESNEVPTLLQEALSILAPMLQKEKTQAHLAWQDGTQQALQEMAEQIPPGTSFILVDEDQWETGPLVAGRRRIPFLEKNGQYWGLPADEQTALSEMERLRQAGAHYVVFAWPAFWWLEHYTGLNQYLRFNFRCVLENDRLVVFDLRHGTAP